MRFLKVEITDSTVELSVGSVESFTDQNAHLKLHQDYFCIAAAVSSDIEVTMWCQYRDIYIKDWADPWWCVPDGRDGRDIHSLCVVSRLVIMVMLTKR